MAIISKGMKLSYKNGNETFKDLTNLQEVPELGGTAESIETTVLTDEAHTYTDGILNYGDSVTFKFLYDKTQFTELNGLDNTLTWKVTLPDNTTCTFNGIASVKLDGVGVNAALTYTLSIKPCSSMVFA